MSHAQISQLLSTCNIRVDRRQKQIDCWLNLLSVLSVRVQPQALDPVGAREVEDGSRHLGSYRSRFDCRVYRCCFRSRKWDADRTVCSEAPHYSRCFFCSRTPPIYSIPSTSRTPDPRFHRHNRSLSTYYKPYHRNMSIGGC